MPEEEMPASLKRNLEDLNKIPTELEKGIRRLAYESYWKTAEGLAREQRISVKANIAKYTEMDKGHLKDWKRALDSRLAQFDEVCAAIDRGQTLERFLHQKGLDSPVQKPDPQILKWIQEDRVRQEKAGEYAYTHPAPDDPTLHLAEILNVLDALNLPSDPNDPDREHIAPLYWLDSHMESPKSTTECWCGQLHPPHVGNPPKPFVCWCGKTHIVGGGASR